MLKYYDVKILYYDVKISEQKKKALILNSSIFPLHTVAAPWNVLTYFLSFFSIFLTFYWFYLKLEVTLMMSLHWGQNLPHAKSKFRISRSQFLWRHCFLCINTKTQTGARIIWPRWTVLVSFTTVKVYIGANECFLCIHYMHLVH